MARTTKPCLCSQLVTDLGRTTGCAETTTGKYAPGHDAKAKSFLISVGVAQETGKQDWLRLVGNEGTSVSYLVMAEHLGYLSQVVSGVDKQVAKIQARNLRGLGKVTAPKGSQAPAASATDLAQVVAQTEAEHLAEERRKVQERQATEDW